MPRVSRYWAFDLYPSAKCEDEVCTFHRNPSSSTLADVKSHIKMNPTHTVKVLHIRESLYGLDP